MNDIKAAYGEGGMPTPSAHHSTRKRLANFAVANLVSVGAAVGLYLLVATSESSNGFFERTLDFFLRHETAMVLAATGPLLASLLVGYGYMQRARRRKAREAAAAAIAAAAAAGEMGMAGRDPTGTTP